MDWDQIGAIAAMVGTGAIGWLTGKRKRKVSESADNAQISGYTADRTLSEAASAQIKSLVDRVGQLEKSHDQLWMDQQADKRLIVRLQMRQAQLESILRAHEIPVPPETP